MSTRFSPVEKQSTTERATLRLNGRMHLALYWLLLFTLFFLSILILLPGQFLALYWHPVLLSILLLLDPTRRFVDYLYGRTGNVQAEKYSLSLVHLTPLNWPIYLLLVWLPVNLWSSVVWSISWSSTGYLLVGITLYAILMPLLSTIWHSYLVKEHSQGEAAAIYVGNTLVAAGVLLTIVFPFIVIWKPQFRLFYLPLYDYLRSLQLNIGETVHPNVLGGALVLTIPITVTAFNWIHGRDTDYQHHRFYMVHNWLGVGRIALISMALLLQFGAVILSQSRGSYLAVGAALTVVATLQWPRLRYLLPVGAVVAVIAIRNIGLSFVLEQFSSDGTLGGWAGRLEIWQTSVMAIRDFPFTGIGIGTFTRVIPLLYPLSFPIESYPHAHNLFLQIGVDVGIPGLVAYLALLINLCAMLIITLRKTPRHTMMYSLTVGATGSFVGMLTHGMLDAVTWGTKLSFLPWILFALITHLFLQTEQIGTNNMTPIKSERKKLP